MNSEVKITVKFAILDHPPLFTKNGKWKMENKNQKIRLKFAARRRGRAAGGRRRAGVLRSTSSRYEMYLGVVQWDRGVVGRGYSRWKAGVRGFTTSHRTSSGAPYLPVAEWRKLELGKKRVQKRHPEAPLPSAALAAHTDAPVLFSSHSTAPETKGLRSFAR